MTMGGSNASVDAGSAGGPSHLWRIFRGPLLVMVLTIFGLLSALVGDGWWDVLSWLALGLPLGVLALWGLPIRRNSR
jgi:hypothetical protein